VQHARNKSHDSRPGQARAVDRGTKPGPKTGLWRGDPNDAKLELGCGVLEGLGGASEAGGLILLGTKLKNTKLSAVPTETPS
jgi:hypothetical protein